MDLNLKMAASVIRCPFHLAKARLCYLLGSFNRWQGIKSWNALVLCDMETFDIWVLIVFSFLLHLLTEQAN